MEQCFQNPYMKGFNPNRPKIKDFTQFLAAYNNSM